MPHRAPLRLLALAVAAPTRAADARLDSWLTRFTGQYARVYLTDADRTSGTAVSTWTRGSISQALPACCGVYEISVSANWVYLRTTGLGSHTMGPGHGDAARLLQKPGLSNGGADVTLTGSSTEGGTYVVAASTNLQTWATNVVPSVTATSGVSRATEPGVGTNLAERYY